MIRFLKQSVELRGIEPVRGSRPAWTDRRLCRQPGDTMDEHSTRTAGVAKSEWLGVVFERDDRCATASCRVDQLPHDKTWLA